METWRLCHEYRMSCFERQYKIIKALEKATIKFNEFPCLRIKESVDKWEWKLQYVSKEISSLTDEILDMKYEILSRDMNL